MHGDDLHKTPVPHQIAVRIIVMLDDEGGDGVGRLPRDLVAIKTGGDAETGKIGNQVNRGLEPVAVTRRHKAHKIDKLTGGFRSRGGKARDKRIAFQDQAEERALDVNSCFVSFFLKYAFGKEGFCLCTALIKGIVIF